MTNRRPAVAVGTAMLLAIGLSLAAVAAPCVLSGDRVPVGALYVPGGPMFARAAAVPEATIAFAGAGPAAATLAGRGVRLDVAVARDALVVYPVGELAVEDWLFAGSSTALVPGASRRGRLAIGVPAATLVAAGLDGAAAADGWARCDAVSLERRDWGYYAGDDVLVGVDGAPVALEAASGAALGTLPDGQSADVLRRVGPRAEVRVPLSGGFVARGWVAGDAVRATPVSGGILGVVSGESGGCALRYAPARRCAAALPLSVRTAAGVAEIGALAPGRPFLLTGGEGPLREVTLPKAWFTLSDDATLWVPAAAEACPRDGDADHHASPSGPP